MNARIQEEGQANVRPTKMEALAMRQRENPFSSQPSTETCAQSGQKRGRPYPIERNDGSSESKKEEKHPPNSTAVIQAMST